MKPFLKWAGNKYQIMSRIREVLPPGNRLIEPFSGSAAVFLNTDYPAYLLSDVNGDLIQLYRYLQADGQAFIDFCKSYFCEAYNHPDAYYALREEFNRADSDRVKAALFLYLNKHGYNGLCRYNLRGEFNVPFGKYKKPYFPEKEMQYFHQKAQAAEIRRDDFSATMMQARKGDVVYCDPPYVPLSATANFTGYSATGFGLEEQQALADMANFLSRRGVTVVISNHDTPFVQDVYQAARVIPFQVQRYISCQGDKRSKAGEVLAVFAG